MASVYAEFHYATKHTSFKTKLGNKHDLDYYTSGEFVNYITQNAKCTVFDDNETINESLYTSSLEAKRNWYKQHLKENSQCNLSGIYSLMNNKAIDEDIQYVKDQLCKDKQIVWEMLVAPGELGVENNVLDKQRWHEILHKNFKGLLIANKLDPNNVQGYYSIHGNTDHPHVHLFFYELNPTRKKGKFTKESIKTFQFKVANSIESSNEYALLNQIQKNVWEVRKHINAYLQNHLTNNLKEKKLIQYKSFFSAAHAIANELSSKKNKSYKSISDANKLNVQKIIEFLKETNDEFKNLIDNYNHQLQVLENLDLKDKYLIERLEAIKQKEAQEFELQIGNKICKAIDNAFKTNKDAFKSKSSLIEFLNIFNATLNFSNTRSKLLRLAYMEFQAQSIKELEIIEENRKKIIL